MCKHIYNSEIQYPEDTPFTYLIGWSKLNIFYYGVRFRKKCHPDDLWTKYFTSSPTLWQFRIDNGEPDIIKVDFTFDTKEEALTYEEYFLLKMDAAHSSQWLNLHNGGKNFFGQKASLETLQKMSDSHKGLKRSTEAIKKAADSNRGQKRTPETCENISNAKKGKPQSPEHIKNSANARRGLKKSSETKQKIRETNLGQKRTSEACNNIANSLKGKFWITNLEIQIFVKPEESEILYSFGFLKGTLINIYK